MKKWPVEGSDTFLRPWEAGPQATFKELSKERLEVPFSKRGEMWWIYKLCIYLLLNYSYIYIYIWVTIKMVEDHFSIAGVFCQRCARNTVKRQAPPKSDNTWDHTRQSIKLGLNQANTGVHIHRPGKTDEGNSTCGAVFPAVTMSFGIQLAGSLSLSLALYRFCGKFP